MMTITAGDMRTRYEVAANREAILSWVRAQGLEPDHVYSVTGIGPFIRARVYVLDEHGNKQLHPRRTDRARLRTRWLVRRSRLPVAL